MYLCIHTQIIYVYTHINIYKYIQAHIMLCLLSVYVCKNVCMACMICMCMYGMYSMNEWYVYIFMSVCIWEVYEGVFGGDAGGGGENIMAVIVSARNV